MRDKVVRQARRLRLGVLSVSAAALLIYVGARLGLPGFTFRATSAPPGFAEAAWPVLADAVVILLGFGVFSLIRMLRAVERCGPFARETVRHFRSFAAWLLILSLLLMAAPLFLNFFATETTSVRLRFDVRDLIAVAVAGLLFLLTQLLDSARAVQDELQEIV